MKEPTTSSESVKAPKIATYSRVSTSHHDQNPQVQVEELRRYCSSRNWTIAHEIVDHGFTGSSDDRPGLKKLMSLIHEREIDIIIVVKLDRLFRSLKHLVLTLDMCTEMGIQFIAIKDNIDYSTSIGRLIVQFLGGLAEFERSLIQERVMMGLAYAKSKGKKLGRPPVGDEQKILELWHDGLSYREIKQELKCSLGKICRVIKCSKNP